MLGSCDLLTEPAELAVAVAGEHALVRRRPTLVRRWISEVHDPRQLIPRAARVFHQPGLEIAIVLTGLLRLLGGPELAADEVVIAQLRPGMEAGLDLPRCRHHSGPGLVLRQETHLVPPAAEHDVATVIPGDEAVGAVFRVVLAHQLHAADIMRTLLSLEKGRLELRLVHRQERLTLLLEDTAMPAGIQTIQGLKEIPTRVHSPPLVENAACARDAGVAANLGRKPVETIAVPIREQSGGRQRPCSGAGRDDRFDR